MSTPHSHTDFILPGTKIRGLEAWTVALAYAYSTKFNVRRVESLFYGIWNTVLNDLVFDMVPKVFVVPQFLIDTGYIKDNVNPNTSIATAAQKDANEVTPDFALVEIQCTVPQGSSLTNTLNFSCVTITKAKTPALVEVKRPPTRRPASLSVFSSSVQSLLVTAQEGLIVHAENAFQDQQETDSMLLIACCGVWWSWRRVTRETLGPADSYGDFLFEQDEEDDEIVWNPDISSEERSEDDLDEDFVPSRKDKDLLVAPREQHKRKAGERPKYTVEKEPPIAQSDLVSYKPGEKGKGKKPARYATQHFTHLEESYMAVVKENADEAQPEAGEWSKILHLGSQASNQNMYIVYHEIKRGRMA